MKKSNSGKRKTWHFPWSYRESFLIAMELLLIGFILELLFPGRSVPTIEWPVNLISGVVLIILIVFIQRRYSQKPFIKWISSIPAAMGAIVLFTFLSLLLGFLPQQAAKEVRFADMIGLTHLKQSWPFLIAMFYFLITLGFVTLRRMLPFRGKNIGFFLNHGGLWIIIFSAMLGAGDLKKLRIRLNEGGEFKNAAVNYNMQLYKLPFELKLLDFRMEEYTPKLTIIEGKDYKIAENMDGNMLLATENESFNIGQYKIHVDTLFKTSKPFRSRFYPIDTIGAVQSMHVTVRSEKSKNEYRGWISPGGFMIQPKMIRLDSNQGLALTTPEAKLFSSKLAVNYKGEIDTVNIEVNKPYKLGRWKIYQSSYDSKMGRYSKTSILEAIYDPWLPAVYAGIFLLMGGAVYIFWIGKDKKD